MATPGEALLRRKYRRINPSSPSTGPNTAICSSFLKQVFLHEWWLIKVNLDSHGKRLGIGGFTSKESQGIKSFSSAPIVKRLDAVTLKTVDGMTVLVHGHLNRSHTLENGFSSEVCDHFMIGFPYYWEAFAAQSDDEQAAHFSVSKGIFSSDAYKMPTPRDNGSSMLSRSIFDGILQQSNGDAFPCSGASIPNGENSQPIKAVVSKADETLLNHKKLKAQQKRSWNSNVEDVEHCGPVTRSRTRCWKSGIASR